MEREVMSLKTAFSGKIFDVVQKKVRREDGLYYDRDVVVMSDAVAILAINMDDEVILVYEYRDAIKRNVVSVPAGLIDKGENIYNAVIRELEEETGIHHINTLKYVGEIYSSEGYSTEKTHMFIAKVDDSDRYDLDLDEDEQIEDVTSVSFETVLEMVEANSFKGKAINYLILMANRMRQRGEL